MVSDYLGNEAGAKKWQQAVTGLQRKMADLISSNPHLSRNYAREKVYTPINTLMKDFRYDDKYDNMRERVNPEKFNRHVRGTKEYKAYLEKGTKSGGKPSYLSISAKKAQSLIDSVLTKEDFNHPKVTKTFDEYIGYYVNQSTGERTRTKTAIIHISKTGIHIVPTKPKEG